MCCSFSIISIFQRMILKLLLFLPLASECLLIFQCMILFPLQSACVDNPCDNNSTCQSGFTDKGYRCLCITGFKGPRCKKGNPCVVKPAVGWYWLQFYTQFRKAPVKVKFLFLINSHNNRAALNWLLATELLQNCRTIASDPTKVSICFSHLIFTSAMTTF